MSSKSCDDLYDMTFDPNGSPVLQLMLVFGSKEADTNDNLIRRVLNWSEFEAYEKRVADARAAAAETVAAPSAPTPRSWVDDMVRDQCSSHVLEAILQFSSDELYFQILKRMFCGHISGFATAPFAILLCKSCWSVHAPAHLESILKEIKPALPQLINPNLLGASGVWRRL